MIIKNAMVTGKGKCDILIENGAISDIGEISASDTEVIDADGLTVCPGLFDMHVHLRDPGQTDKEDIFTGTAAAAAGGVTSVVSMPNTNPPISSPEQIEYILKKAETATAKVFPSATITKDMSGTKLADFEALAAAGAAAFTDDGRPVENSKLMMEALYQAGRLNIPVLSHSEDLFLAAGGVINEGDISKALGVQGIPQSAEDIAVSRECMLSLYTGAPIHICHVSSRFALECIRMAKMLGGRVTCETAPHYFALDDTALLSKSADFKMNPPLRSSADVEAVKAAIADGTIDVIATDHAPHTSAEKHDLITAPNGIIGMETSFSVSYTYLVKTGIITMERLIQLMSETPAQIMRKPELGRLAPGTLADIALVDLNEEYIVDKAKLHGKSANTPFHGMALLGRVKQTILNGKTVFEI